MYGLDLFSGIGGITKALEPYVRPVAYCENDRYAQAVLLSRMADGSLPVAPIWDDVRTLKGDILPELDIIYGGFPCQDISVAGRGAGLAGKRSGLFFEIARLVSEIRPRFIFLENVSAITRRGGDVVVGTLAGLGYDCRWDIISAADVGANHQRERWWLLAYSRRELQQGSQFQRTDGLETKEQNADQPERPGEVANADSTRCEEQWRSKPDGTKHETAERGSWWKSEPAVGRVAHGIPFRVDRLKGLGNAVVPAQAREAFERMIGGQRWNR